MHGSWSGCTSGSLGGLSGCLGRKCRSLRSGGIWIDRNMRLIVRGNGQGTGGRFLFQVKSRGKKRRRGQLWGRRRGVQAWRARWWKRTELKLDVEEKVVEKQGDLNVVEKQKMEEEVEEDLEVEGEGGDAIFSARNGKELKNAYI